MPDEHPDFTIVDLVVQLLNNFDINSEILRNWQVDLVDSTGHKVLVETAILQDVLLQFPLQNYFDRSSRDGFVQVLKKLLQLDVEVYGDFILIVHELMIQAATASYAGKIQLYRFRILPVLIDDLLQFLENIDSRSGAHKLIAAAKIRMIVAFMELGCEVKQMRRLIGPLFAKSSRVLASIKQLYMDLLLALLEQYPSHFTFSVYTQFMRKSLLVPLSSEFGLLKCFTLSCWFKINHVAPEAENDDISVVSLFLLANASTSDSTALKLQLINMSQFMVEIQNTSTGSRMQFTFNHILHHHRANQGYTHIAVTYDSYQNLNLFVDGDYSESIPCVALAKTMGAWNKIYIGQHDGNLENVENVGRAMSRQELLLKDLNVLSVSLPYEWISTLYALGIGFDWSCREYLDENIANCINSLSARLLVGLGFRCREIIDAKLQSHSSGSKFLHQSHLSSMRAETGPKAECADKKRIVALLLKTKLRKSHVLFDSNDAGFLSHIERPRAEIGSNATSASEILVHESTSIHGSIYCLGGASLLLTLVEVLAKDHYENSSERDSLFFRSIELLLQCLQNSWRINKEFDNVDGYSILALLIKFYKDSYNPELDFDSAAALSPALSASASLETSVSSLGRGSLLQMFLGFVGCSHESSQDGIIYNTSAYRFLVLNFEICCGTADAALQQKHLQSLMCDGRYHAYNVRELSKMKLPRRLIQFIKLQALDENLGPLDLGDLSRTLSAWIHADISVETIKSVSQFVVFALYGPTNDSVRKVGLDALQSLADELCDPQSSIKSLKKFSRSITIHWILLLLSYRSENDHEAKRVVHYGITLLIKLLRVLGPHIIKRFFHANKGLDVLTHFLLHWWSSDEVNSLLFLAAFGTDISTSEISKYSLPQLVKNKKITQSQSKLPMPDFMHLLNNMALTGMYNLSLKHGRILSVPSSPIRKDGKLPEDEIFEISFNALHLINQYSEVIEVGFAESPALQDLFTSKEWLEGAIELLGHLKLALTWPTQFVKNFEQCYDKYVSVLNGIFISKLTRVKQLFAMLNSLNEITSRIVLDSIFPSIFSHVNQFVESSNFIFNEKEFLNGCIELLNYYSKEFLLQNFYIRADDLSVFIACIVFVMETCMSNTSVRKGVVLELADELGNAIVVKLSSMKYSSNGDGDVSDDSEAKFAQELDENVKFLMYKQAVILQPGLLSDSFLRQIIELLMGNFLKLRVETQLNIAEHLLNFLRTTYIMRQDSFGKIVEDLTSISDYQNSGDILFKFFDDLTSHNDEETIRQLQKFPTIRHIFVKNYHFRMSKLEDVGKVRAMDMISVMLNNGGSLGYMDNIYIKSFEKDCLRLRVLTINAELNKYNRELQDELENSGFYIGSFNSLKMEIFRILMDSSTRKSAYILDYIEGVDRMRKLLVVEDQLAESEKLTYNVAVPIKAINEVLSPSSDFDDYSFAFAYSGVNTLSLSENPLLGSEVDEYEEIDEVPEQEPESAGVTVEDRNRKVLRSLYMGDQIQTIWNVSRINGLDAVESLMILGFSHLYMTENYFHCPDGNVVDVLEAPGECRDPYLQLIKSSSGLGVSKTHRTKSWSLETLSSVSKRKFLLRDCAMEMFFSDGASILITCLSSKQRDAVYSKILPYANGKGLDRDLALTLEISSNTLQHQTSGSGGFFTSKLTSAFSSSFNSPSALAATKKWRMGEMSNFYYLMTLNTLAGRTYNDLTQYPVFPWVIADYDSETLDLSDPESFRDLSKPMGAQTPSRARQFEERYEALGSLHDSSAPPFHYGTHYSSAMIVASYLIRLKPYVQSYLLLQGGKFDHADRLFNSVGKAWSSASRDNTTDIRELIPEFFYLPEFLVNLNNFEFGQLQSGVSANDVDLPKWAKGDPKIFIAKNREALESPYVSANLHKWIDLVFGYKQNGPEAVKALNVFHHLSYDGAINLDNIKDEMEKRAVIGMINNFGQTPMRLFTKPHPLRDVLNLPGLYFTKIDHAPRITFESKLSLPIEKLEISAKTKNRIGRPACASSEDELLIRKPSQYQSSIGCGSLVINTTLFMNLHSADITCVLQIGNKRFVTGSADGVIQVWKCTPKPVLMVSNQNILRGHFSGIRTLCYSKTFKVCLSVDCDGVIILWDFTRFGFVRKIRLPATPDHPNVLVAISNDTGNICTVHSTKYANALTIFTINGDTILHTKLTPGHILALAVAGLNDSLVESPRCDYLHSYWPHEVVAVSYAGLQKLLNFYELVPTTHAELLLLQSVDVTSHVSGVVTCMQVTKQVAIDTEEKLSRGNLYVVFGDSTGKVYVM